MNQAVIREPQNCLWNRVICILYCLTVIQYITVSGGTCNMLSVFWQFTGEIWYIKVPKNDSKEWLKRNVDTHENEWTERPRCVKRLAVDEEHFLDQNSTSSLTRLHLYTTSHWCKCTSRHHTISSLILRRDQIWSAESSEDEARCLEWRVQPGFLETQSSRDWKILV